MERFSKYAGIWCGQAVAYVDDGHVTSQMMGKSHHSIMSASMSALALYLQPCYHVLCCWGS